MKNLFFVAFYLLINTCVRAQGWEKLYPIDLATESFGLVPTADGGFWFSMDASVPTSEPHLLIKLSATGAYLGVQNQQDVLGLVTPRMIPAGNGDLLFAAYESSSSTRLVKTNSALQVSWSTSIPGANNCHSFACKPILEQVADGYIIAFQISDEWSPAVFTRIDEAGNLVWQKSYDFNALGTEFRVLYDVAADSLGNLYVTGVQDFPYAPVLAKLSPAGDLLFTHTYTQPELVFGFGTLAVLNNNRIAGNSSSNIAMLDSTGAVLQIIAQSAGGLRSSGDGNLLLGASTNGNLTIRKITPGGVVLWSGTSDLVWSLEGPYDLWPLPDGGVAAIGRAFTGGGYLPFVIRTDAGGLTYTNQISGFVFTDLDQNCAYSAEDSLGRNQIVRAEKNGEFWYTSSDSSGNYALPLDSGAYTLQLLPPNALWQPCTDSISATLTGTFDTLQVDLGLGSTFNCPWPEIDLGAPFLRRCFESQYSLTYANLGNVLADSAVVTLTLDPFLIFQSAGLPYTDLGNNRYSFYLGDLAPLQQGNFQVTVLVDCDSTTLGQTHCSTATLHIANPCPETAIEAPVIRVEAECVTDSVQFKVKNVGGAPMITNAEFVVIEDLLVMRQGSFQLNMQEDTLIRCPSDGSTFRMYAGQAPGQPPFFAATAAVEGCNGPIMPGFWNMFPEVYGPWNTRDCQPNIGSFDPNDKQAVPAGYGPEHYIARGVDLNYKIRFQNTGTDTAFTVVVRDTLSPWLDPGSLRMGNASHPFSWTLLGQGVLEVRFDGIHLPDSATNLAGSQGFVDFHIGQKPGLPDETLILNQAAIYFDFNAPVLTNTTWHRIGEHFLLVDTWAPASPELFLNIHPNPSVDRVVVELSHAPAGQPLEWTLADTHGRVALRQTTQDAGWTLQRGALPAGVYWLRVQAAGRVLGLGKLVLMDKG